MSTFLARRGKFCNNLSEPEGESRSTRSTGRPVRVPDRKARDIACRRKRNGNTPAGRGRPTRYSFGDDAASLGEFGWFGELVTHPVGQKLTNRFGLSRHARQCLGVVLGRLRRGLLQAFAGG